MGDAEVLPAGGDELAFQGLPGGEGHGVHQEVQVAPDPLEQFKGHDDLLVGGDIHGNEQRLFQGLRQLPHMLAHPLVLVGDGQFRAFRGQLLGDAPGDGPLVGDPHHQPPLPLHEHACLPQRTATSSQGCPGQRERPPVHPIRRMDQSSCILAPPIAIHRQPSPALGAAYAPRPDLDAGRYLKALADAEAVLQQQPGNALAWAAKSQALTALVRLPEALEAAQQGPGAQARAWPTPCWPGAWPRGASPCSRRNLGSLVKMRRRHGRPEGRHEGRPHPGHRLDDPGPGLREAPRVSSAAPPARPWPAPRA